MEDTFIDLMTTKGVVGVLVAFILFLIALLKIVFDMYKLSNKERHDMGREVMGLILKSEVQSENMRKENEKLHSKLESIQNSIYERNNR